MGPLRSSLRGHLRGRPADRPGAGDPVRLHAGPAVAGDRRLPGRGGTGHAGAGGVGAPRRQVAGRDRPRRAGALVEAPTVTALAPGANGEVTLPARCVQQVRGSSWGVFTIACTIPIALFVGLYMYRIRKGHVVEASLIGAVLVLAATVAGSWIPHSPLREYFSLTRNQTPFALAAYGFVASVLPVWMLLCPRAYLSCFLKIGTIILLIGG